MNSNEVLTPHMNEVLDEIARAGVLIPCQNDIAAYLQQHPDMTSLVAQLAFAAREQLPRDAQLSLELYRDPEIDDTYLTLYVRQRHYIHNLTKRTHAIMDEFDHELATCSGWLLLTTDYRPPR